MAFHNSCKFLYTTTSCNTQRLLLFMILWCFSVDTLTLYPSPVSCTPTGVRYRQDSSSQGALLCKESERKSLFTFKAGLIDDDSLLSSWSDDIPNCCSWKGVICDNHTGYILKLNLRGSDFSGSLRGKISSSLLELKYLQYLDLSLNNFGQNTIPAFLGSFQKLRYLNLSNSFFSGIIPPHLGNLSSLQYLDLGLNGDPPYYAIAGVYDNLEVKSLEWLRGLPYLKYLNLNYINLDKAGLDWLKQFNMVPSLLELHLSYCHLSNLPQLVNHSINFTSVSTLDLSHNNFSSSFDMPSWLFNLTGLVNLDISYSSLQDTLTIPREIGKLVQLQKLDFSNNNIGGQLPGSLGNLSNLVILNLENNGLEGRIPVAFGHLCQLRTLDLGYNYLEGEISEFFDGLARCESNHLESLSLGSFNKFDNSFSGSIPTTIGSLTSLRTLYLYGNNMNGTIAEAIGKVSKLEDLDLSFNPWQGVLTETHFEKHTKLRRLYLLTTSEGTLSMNMTQEWLPPFRGLTDLQLDGVKMWSAKFPRWTRALHKLEDLSLLDCGISDSIPTEFWKSCTSITSLYLSNNAISIDESFKNLESLLPLVPAANLESLYLTDNNFSSGGEIPLKIGLLVPSLLQLDLSSSSLSGEIPISICELKSLKTLSLRNNTLSGELTHHQWEELKVLKELDLSSNRLVGEIPESLGSSNHLTLLSLNDNHLHGEIPTFRSCTGLQGLDFGGNKLTGKIPSSLAENKTNLLVLKLRGNMLSGVIPPELCLLSSLKTLDLSQNNFEGIIPWCLGNMSTTDGGDIDYTLDGITLVSKGREYDFGPRNLFLVHLVDLSHNGLSGEIPESLCNITALQTLNLFMNHLTGKIPPKIGALPMLESLDLSQNRLSGPIPHSIADMSSLSFFNVSHNNLSGRIPSSRQLETLEESSSFDGNPLLCGLPLPTKCPGDGTTKGEGEEKVHHNKRRFDLEEWGFVLSLVLGFFVGFWGVCGSLVMKASWRQAYFGYLEGIKDKIIVTVFVNVARLQKKMGDIGRTN